MFFDDYWDINDPKRFTDADLHMDQLEFIGKHELLRMIRKHADKGACIIYNPLVP